MQINIEEVLKLFQNNQTERAMQLIHQYLNQASNDEKYQIANGLIEAGFIQMSKEILEELVNDDPQNNDYKASLADIYIEMEQDDRAMDLLHDIDVEDPNYLRSLIQLADLYQVQGLFEVAEQKLFEAKEIEPNHPIIELALAELYFSIGNYNQCIQLYEQLHSDAQMEFTNISIPARLAEAYAAIGAYEKAFQYFQSVSRDDPDMLFKYGLTAYHIGRKEVAISAWEQLIEQDPHYYSSYYYLGKAYYDERMFDEAYRIASEGLKYDEHNDKLFYLAAKAAYNIGEFEESKFFIQQAIRLNPDDFDAIRFYIDILTEIEEYVQIIAFIEKMSMENVYDPIFDWEIARAYHQIEEFTQAKIHYEEAYEYYEKDPIFLHEYGLFLAELGEFHEAISILQKYLTFEPLDDDVAEYVQRLKYLK